MVYLPAHYIIRFSPLRFIDVPKMRTITNYGDEIVLTNSAYINVTSDAHIWLINKIIELLEIRILMFKDLMNQFEKTKTPAAVPHWFAETISAYWDIAGLPHKVAGAFYNPLFSTAQIPATLTFAKDETGQDYFGWYFSIGEGKTFSLFLDPRKSAKKIYDRRGKTPAQRTVKLDCTLYANPGISAPLEQDIVERCVKPFVRVDREGIDVRIIFDGTTFEIWEYPAAHANTLIFRGRALL
jgi:hypothetical protein